MKKILSVLLTALAFLTGCNKQDSYTYSGIEAGTLSSGIFTSDNGTRMKVEGNEGHYDVTTSRRVLISFETHPITDPSQISIDILGLLDAGILQPGRVDALPEDPSGSPLEVTDAWFSGEYLNLLVTFEGKEAEKHTFATTYSVSGKGISFHLDHDGSQDATAGDSPLSIFLSIPMYEPVLSYDQTAQATGVKPEYPVSVLLQWTARTLEGGPLTLLERKGSYQPPSDN